MVFLRAGQDDEVVVALRAATSSSRPRSAGGSRWRSTGAATGRWRCARPPAAAIRGRVLERQAVLGVELHVAAHTETPRSRATPVRSSSIRTPSSNSERSPRNLLIGEAAEQRALSGVSSCDGPDDRAEHAAALDVGDQHPRRPDPRHQPEVHEVVLAQVQLADAARALDHDDVEAARQVVVGRRARAAAELVGVRVVLARGQGLPHPPVDDDLAAAVRRSA